MFPPKSLDQSRHFNLLNNNSRIKKLQANHSPKLVIYFCLSVDKSFCKSVLRLSVFPVAGRDLPTPTAVSLRRWHTGGALLSHWDQFYVFTLTARLGSSVPGPSPTYMFSAAPVVVSFFPPCTSLSPLQLGAGCMLGTLLPHPLSKLL